MAWFICVIIILLLCTHVGQCTPANASRLIEHTAEDLYERMQSGKTIFVYFGHQVNPTIGLFLDQLEKSADALEDYGISVAKVNCTKQHIAKYCTGDKLMKKAHLFRGAEILKSFDIDTVFDVNAIVSHVLFSVLFDEVQYVHTAAELRSVERSAKGKADVVLGHVQVMGLPEHRALMETAFVYGAKYQFVLTTGGPVLEHMGVKEPSSLSAGLWFLHCREVSQWSAPCPHTALRRALTTLHIYTFLQLMEAPLVTEVSEDPSEVKVVHSHLQVPLLFLFSQPHTLALDRATAQTLAWRLRGQVGLVLTHRESPAVKTPPQYNAAYKLPGEGSEVKYFTLNNLEEVMGLFREESAQEGEEEEALEEEEGDDDWATLDILDDEVAESVYRDRGQTLDMDAVTELTADTFDGAVARSDHLVVLFYVKWDAVSMAFIHSFIEVAETLEDAEVSDVEMAAVDCGEWTHVCSSQPITSFPTVRLHRPGAPAQPYRGMLGTGGLHRFILLSRLASPVLLASPEEVTSFLGGDLSFLGGDLYLHHAAVATVRVLGLFSSATDTGVSVFRDAVAALRGEALVGLYADRQAEPWSEEYSVKLPVMLVSHGPKAQTEAFSLHLSTPDQLVTHIQKALLDTFPELTVENLPSYLGLKKPLLLLFVGEEEEAAAAAEEEEKEETEKRGRREKEGVIEETRGLLRTGRVDPYLLCWIHLGRTPAGKAVLETYLGSLPPLPALVLSQLSTGGEVFHYPPDRAIMVQPVLEWLQSVEDGDEAPAGVIGDEKWGPPVPFYDFLSVMDQEVPGYTAQRSPRTKTKTRQSGGREEEEAEEEEEEEEEGGEKEKNRGMGGSESVAQAQNPPGSVSKPPTPHQHSEL